MKTTNPKITTGNLPASRKFYVSGTLYPDISVPMREIAVHPTAGEEPLTVYDTSGPYTDPDVVTEITRGLLPRREEWIRARGDVEAYEGRVVTPADNGFVAGERLTPEFPVVKKPLRATGAKAATQLAYARVGIITPEMEFVVERQPSWPVPTTTLADGVERKTGMPVWRAAPSA